MHTHIYIHTYMHIHTYKYIHIHIHTYTYPNQNCFKMIVENLASFNRTNLFEEQSNCSSFKWLGRI